MKIIDVYQKGYRFLTKKFNFSLQERAYYSAKLTFWSKKIAAQSIYYTSLAISLLFTIGGAVFAIPPICEFFNLGQIAILSLEGLCSVAAFWGTYVVYGVCLNDMVSQLFGIEQEVSDVKQQDSNYKPGLLKYLLVCSMLGFNAIFYIAGSYFAMLQLLPFFGLKGNILASGLSLVLAAINYIPTFALNGMSLIRAELNIGNQDGIKVSENNVDLNDNPAVIRPVCSVYLSQQSTLLHRSGISKPVLDIRYSLQNSYDILPRRAASCPRVC